MGLATDSPQLQYTPTFSFHSERSNFSIVLTDDYAIRNKVLGDLHRYSRAWLKAGLNRAPLEMRGLLQVRFIFRGLRSMVILISNRLQSYIDGPANELHSHAFGDDEMGKSVAVDLVRLPPASGKGGEHHFSLVLTARF